MKLKKAKEYVDISKLSFKSKTIQIEIIKEWIKQAQLDAIEETCKFCAERGQVEVIDHEELYITSLPGYDRKIDQVILPIYGVDEQSILNCAKILKKQLE